jgi:uncharacterized Zn finger protein
MSSSLSDACAPARLLRVAGGRCYERGEDYAAGRRVRLLAVDTESAVASVAGTTDYRVRLWLDDGALRGSCTCPAGGFCKHCVATALAVSEDAGPATADLRSFLLERPREELVDLLLGALERDPLLRDRLEFAMATDDDALAAAIDAAAHVPDYVDHREAWAYAERLDGILDALETRLDGGPAEVVMLTERFMQVVEAALAHVDDSNGATGTTVERAQALHLDACLAARPDPRALAECLFELERSSDLGLLHGAVDKYAEVLGETGRARYAELAEAAWARVDGSPPWPLTQIMERLAAGDVDRLVAIKARGAERGWHYLEIAELLRDAGRAEEAIDWAERSVAVEPGAPARMFLADGYRALGRPDAALAQRAAHFREQPTLPTYQALLAEAEPLGLAAEQREAALAQLLAAAPDHPARPQRRWAPDRSVLVAILLWEDDVSGAWEHAVAGGCSRDLWRALARERVAQRPGDAVAVYRRLLDRTIDLKSDGAYREAIELLAELHGLLVPHGHEAAHGALVVQLREVHRRKRNLIRMLDAQQWPAPCP